MNQKRFPAVTIVPAGNACAAAKALDGRMMLATEAPRLPLTDCAAPLQCQCRFAKHADRRDADDERRMMYASHRADLYAGPEQRESRGRRDKD